MKNIILGRIKHVLSLVSVSLITLMAAGIYAQETPASTSSLDDENIEIVTVTGSRIKRSNVNSAVPLQVFTEEDILEVGSLELQDILVDIPGVELGVSDQGSTNSIQTNGLNSISLRRLGDDRSLTLVNGKRGVSNSGNSNRFDVSTIPVGFVKSLDVTTGGASAVYGSDAIAGVVNILLEDDYEGARVGFGFETPEASGRDERSVNFLSGHNFNDDKGYVLFGANILDRNALFADSSRPAVLLPIEFDDPDVRARESFADEPNQPGCGGSDPALEDRHCFLGSFSGSTPGGVFENGDAWFVNGQWFNDEFRLAPGRNGLPRAVGQDFFTDFDGYNFREDRALLNKAERANIGINASYEFNSNLFGKATLLYSDNTTSTPRGYETLNDDDVFGPVGEFSIGNIPANNPLIPVEVEEISNGSSISFDRRLVELGQQTRFNERETIRFFTDISGDFKNGFDWEAYATYGRFNQEQTTLNEYNQRNARHALNVEADGAGGFQCVNAAARAAGCVPLDIFGEGTISPEAADYIRYNAFGTQRLTQHSIGGFVSGDLFDLPAGPVKSVFGLEHRRDLQNTLADPDGRVGGADRDFANDASIDTTDTDVTSAATFPDLKAEQSVLEAFGELEFPLIEDTLAIQIAGRLADYDSVGVVQSWNVGGVWTPSDFLRLRGQVSRSQRAPNLTELYSSPRPDADDLDDPCRDLLPLTGGNVTPGDDVPDNAESRATIRANCLAEPGIQQFFTDNPGDEFDPDDRVQGPNSGNQSLTEETADTFTIGAILSPSFIDATITLDYFKIDIEDAISSVSTQDVVDFCYADTNFSLANPGRFCSAITRRDTDGQVVRVINPQENLNNETVEGIDINASYDFDLDQFVSLPGEMGIDFRFTRYLTDETLFISNDAMFNSGDGTLEGISLTSSTLGELDAPQNQYRLRLGYELNDFRASWTTDYEPGGIDDARNDASPTDDRFFKVGGEFFHRLSLRYYFGDNNKYRLSGTIDNVFDNRGPLVPQGTDSGDSININTNVNDLVGREYRIGLRVKL